MCAGLRDTQIIAWNHNLGTSTTVKIDLTRDNGSVGVDGHRPQRRKALVRVTWTADATVNDQSNVTFQIK